VEVAYRGIPYTWTSPRPRRLSRGNRLWQVSQSRKIPRSLSHTLSPSISLCFVTSKMPSSKGVNVWSMLPSRLYQPIMDQTEVSHVCPACEKPASSSSSSPGPARLHFLAIALGFVGLLLGGYASLQIRSCRQDSTLQDQFIPSEEMNISNKAQ
jgi:hypothetical protein